MSFSEVKQLGIISILFLWAGLIFLIRKWKGNVSMTFSQHAAQNRTAQTFNLAVFLIAVPLFTVFLFGWFIPEYELSPFFMVIAALCAVATLLAGIIPETAGRNIKIHRYSAFLMADCLVPLLILIALSSHFPSAVRCIAALAAAYQLFGIAMLLPHKGYHPKVLPLQASYIAVFHLTILAATYIR